MAAIQEFFSYEAQELQGLRARYNAIAIQGQVIRSKRPKGGEKDQFLIANALTDNDNGPITGWIPSRSAYLSRIARPPNDEAARSTTLPFDFPLSLEGARVWLGQDFKDESKYVVPLHTSDITEIENALSSFKGMMSCNLRRFLLTDFY